MNEYLSTVGGKLYRNLFTTGDLHREEVGWLVGVDGEAAENAEGTALTEIGARGADGTEVFYTYVYIYLHVCMCIHRLCDHIYAFLVKLCFKTLFYVLKITQKMSSTR